MSQLIDQWIWVNHLNNKNEVEIHEKWYIAKPFSYRREYCVWKDRIRDAWRVLMCKSFAVHFKEDERI